MMPGKPMRLNSEMNLTLWISPLVGISEYIHDLLQKKGMMNLLRDSFIKTLITSLKYLQPRSFMSNW